MTQGLEEKIVGKHFHKGDPQSKSQNPFETELLKLAKYRRYEDAYKDHMAKNTNSRIEESIYPQLTGDTLMGKDKVDYRGSSFYFVDDKYFNYNDFNDVEGNNFSLTFLHFGSKLSGHHGIVHGGLLATYLDELTCRLAFLNFESRKGVTANLNINYRRPCYSDKYVLVRCETLKKNGRKCVVKGSIYAFDLGDKDEIESSNNLVTECEVLVIEPKWVQQLKH